MLMLCQCYVNVMSMLCQCYVNDIDNSVIINDNYN